MNKKILLDGLKSLGIFGGIFILFYVGLNLLSEDKKNKWFYSDEKISLISYEQEIALGELIDEYIIASQYKNPLTNKTIDSMMWAVGKRLQGQFPTSEYDYNITVLDNPQNKCVYHSWRKHLCVQWTNIILRFARTVSSSIGT